jgi:hypothetical protein
MYLSHVLPDVRSLIVAHVGYRSFVVGRRPPAAVSNSGHGGGRHDQGGGVGRRGKIKACLRLAQGVVCTPGIMETVRPPGAGTRDSGPVGVSLVVARSSVLAAVGAVRSK